EGDVGGFTLRRKLLVLRNQFRHAPPLSSQHANRIGPPDPAARDTEAVPWDIETPAVVVDTTRLERNLNRMQALAESAGAALRPHAKTHKCLEVGRRQLAHGAAGLTVATLAEAEAFVADGCPSVFIAYPLWAGAGTRPARLAALRDRAELR